jgi:hypothetical protein
MRRRELAVPAFKEQKLVPAIVVIFSIVGMDHSFASAEAAQGEKPAPAKPAAQGC